MELPASIEAEKALIGSVLVRPASFITASAIVSVEDFFGPVHSDIWRSMVNLSVQRKPIDLILIWEDLKSREAEKKLDGGTSYLAGCATSAPLIWNSDAYARIVRDKAALRRLIAACGEISSDAQGEVGSHDEFFRDSVSKVSRVALRDLGTQERAIGEIYDELLVSLEKSEKGEVESRIPTGIAALDGILNGGLMVEHLIVPISQTSIGKSSLLFQVAVRAAATMGVSCLLFSLEMSRQEAFVKMAANLAKVDSSLFAHRSPLMVGDEKKNAERWKTLYGAGTKVAALGEKLRISEHRQIGAIVAAATVWRASHPGPALIGVDHLQKVIGLRGKGITREQEVSGVSQVLKDLARDLKLPIIAPAQLNDTARFEKRPPKIGDTRESRGIEHDADVILGIHRDREKEEGQCRIEVLKHRGGKLGRCFVTWKGSWQGFETPTTAEEREMEG